MKIVKSEKDNYHSHLDYAIGPTIRSFLEDPNVLEIIINPDGKIWVDNLETGKFDTGKTFPKVQAESLTGLMAFSVDQIATQDSPIIFAEMPQYNARFNAVLWPIVESPAINIRKHQSAIYSLDDYVKKGYLDQDKKRFISEALKNKKSILIIGATGSGKTTFANALLFEITQCAPHDRILIIEDTKELQCQSSNKVCMKAQGGNMHDLLYTGLRMTPDRIIVGEVRGKEALALIKAWHVGHTGIATMHGNSCAEALIRLESMLTEAGIQSGYEKLIFAAIDIMVFIERKSSKWSIKEMDILCVDNGRYELQNVC